MTREFISAFPLPVPELERTDPLQYIPDCDDEFGYGERMWRIFSMLKITQGVKAGKRFGDKDVAIPWQEKFIRSLFGLCDKDGVRDYTEAFLYCSKKQGKSSYAGPLAVAYCLAYPVTRGHIVIVSGSIKQASIIFDATAESIRADKSLSTKFLIRDYKKDIINVATGTKIQILALAPESCVGVIPTAVLVDETHVVASKTGAKQLLEQLVSGMATTDNPFLLHTTTSPLNVSKGVFSSLYARAKRVLAGEAPHDRFFPTLYEMPPEHWDDDDYIFNEDNWWRCSPSLGFTVSRKWLSEACQTAKLDADPTSLLNFKAQHLNIIVGDTLNTEKFLPVEVWDRFVEPKISLDYIVDNSTEIYMGVDLGSRDDPSALVIAGIMKDEKIYIWSQQYLHHDGYMKRREVVDYDRFIESGELIVSHEESFDIELMSDKVTQMFNTGKLAGIAIDPMGLKKFVTDLEDLHPGIVFIGIPQGYKMTPAILATERKIYSGELWHQGLPMLSWNIANTSLRQHGEAVALVKPDGIQTSPNKIDGVICIVGVVALTEDPEITVNKGAEIFFI